MGTRASRLRARRPSPATLVSVLAIVIALAGTAVAGVPAIFSGDIVDGEVKTQDVRNDTGAGALKGIDVADGSLTGTEVAIETLTGAEVPDGSLTGAELPLDALGPTPVTGLTGADINEGTLGRVGSVLDARRLDGIARQFLAVARTDGSDSGECSGSLPTLGSYETCADVTVPWYRPGRALVIGSGNWHGFGESGDANCRVLVGAPVIEIGDNDGTHTENHDMPFVLQGVTESLTVPKSGTRTFRLECVGTAQSDVDNAQITVVNVGPG